MGTIIMSDESVRDVIDGRKTQTRRIIDLNNLVTDVPRRAGGDISPVGRGRYLEPGRHRVLMNRHGAVFVAEPRFGLKPGEFNFVCRYLKGSTHLADHGNDRKEWTITPTPDATPLRVKEAYRWWNQNNCHQHEDGADDDEGCTDSCNQVYVAYRATPRIGYRPVPDKQRICYLDDSSPLESDPRLLGPWKSAMFMHSWASRIKLDVTLVRVQRLHDITDEDARAEGVAPFFERFPRLGLDQRLTTGELAMDAEYRASYAVTWDEINGHRELWKTNPWVWAITIRRQQ